MRSVTLTRVFLALAFSFYSASCLADSDWETYQVKNRSADELVGLAEKLFPPGKVKMIAHQGRILVAGDIAARKPVLDFFTKLDLPLSVFRIRLRQLAKKDTLTQQGGVDLSINAKKSPGVSGVLKIDRSDGTRQARSITSIDILEGKSGELLVGEELFRFRPYKLGNFVQIEVQSGASAAIKTDVTLKPGHWSMLGAIEKKDSSQSRKILEQSSGEANSKYLWQIAVEVIQ